MAPLHGGSGCGLRHIGPPDELLHPTAAPQSRSTPAATPRLRTPAFIASVPLSMAGLRRIDASLGILVKSGLPGLGATPPRSCAAHHGTPPRLPRPSTRS